jgi:hypothetical protein
MSIYPDILFHFTNKRNFYKILGSSFKISYARERVMGGSKIKEFAVPMVSFSDLRLSELKENIGTYGKFGIGLTKDWAIKKGLNPVMYASENSFFTEAFLNGIETLFDFVGSNSMDNLELAFNDVMNTLRYIKNYKGDLIRPSKKIRNNYVFANEREWRFVPDISGDFYAFVPIDKTFNKHLLNNKIKHVKLNYRLEDIKYLIVKNDDDIYPLIDYLKTIKGGFTSQKIDKLSSRILTYEQIKNGI